MDKEGSRGAREGGGEGVRGGEGGKCGGVYRETDGRLNV